MCSRCQLCLPSWDLKNIKPYGACLPTSQLLPFRGLCGLLDGAQQRARVSSGLYGALGGSPAGGLAKVRHMAHHKLATQS